MSDPARIPPAPTSAIDARPPPADQLLRQWELGTRVDLEAFVAATGPLSPADLAAVLYVDQHQRWQLGEQTRAESYLHRFPEVCADAEAAVDIIFHEYLLRERLGERPDSAEYAGRFPEFAEALQRQIAFHQLLQRDDAPPAPSLSALSTASIPAPATSPTDRAQQALVGLAARGGLSTGRDVTSLLRQRLRLLSAISFVAFLLYVPVLWTLFTVSWGTALYLAVVAEAAFIAVLLSTRRPFSLPTLRAIEAGLFVGLLAYFGYQQVQFFQVGFFSALALDNWIGPAIAARSMSWPWAVTIISYGILIPNTARRCVVAVAAMVSAFLAITMSLAVTTSAAPPSAIAGYVLCSMTDMTFAAAIAIFGAYRIATLQRAASETRKLGPYRLIRRLGAGGMGEVYLAEHALLRRPCALKLIRPGRGGDAQLLSRFEREVQAMAALTHPNTVRIYDYGLADNGTFYYAMEYLPGLSLQELVTRFGPLAPGRAAYLLRHVCGALREAHAAGLVHRDIKPANILACQVGGMHDVAKLLDFGLVRGGFGAADQSLTGTGTITGTPAFMSPEQAAGATEVDPRSDLYSLGAVAFFLLTGRPPFVHSTSVETMAAHLSETVVPPRALVPGLPGDIEQVVLRCLEKDPLRRYRDVAGVEDALAGCACSHEWDETAAAEWWQSTGSNWTPVAAANA